MVAVSAGQLQTLRPLIAHAHTFALENADQGAIHFQGYDASGDKRHDVTVAPNGRTV
jgi:hypothetical protein